MHFFEKEHRRSLEHLPTNKMEIMHENWEILIWLNKAKKKKKNSHHSTSYKLQNSWLAAPLSSPCLEIFPFTLKVITYQIVRVENKWDTTALSHTKVSSKLSWEYFFALTWQPQPCAGSNETLSYLTLTLRTFVSKNICLYLKSPWDTMKRFLSTISPWDTENTFALSES